MTPASAWTEGIGSLAAICTTIAFVPQLVRVWRRRSADDISLSMFLLFSTGEALWLTYGLRIRSAPVIAANVVTLALALVILVLKLRFGMSKAVQPERGESGKIEV